VLDDWTVRLRLLPYVILSALHLNEPCGCPARGRAWTLRDHEHSKEQHDAQKGSASVLDDEAASRQEPDAPRDAERQTSNQQGISPGRKNSGTSSGDREADEENGDARDRTKNELHTSERHLCGWVVDRKRRSISTV